MDAPECPFCHKKEWRHVCGTGFGLNPGLQERKRALGKNVVEVAGGTPKIAVEAPKKKFDRTAYQREYMKKWRAKK